MNKADNYNKTDLKVYQHQIRKLIYFLCSIIPDIPFVVGHSSKWNVDSRIGYFRAVKQVIQYLKNTIHLGITYKASNINPRPYGLVRYANSNYTGNPKDQKSIMKHYFFFNNVVLSQCSKKQQIVSISTTKAKYIVLGHIVKETRQIKEFLNELKIDNTIGACTLYGDNETSIILTINTES